ncbi:MAG TPA: NAD(P)H-hydrate dehydratase [Solirubrobacterales bacterium]|nr:NAD(P)H-hydrate dehydratase [Solirubrobacterales bacterium]
MRPEPWLEGVHDADSMRAADRWAIEERGIPSLQLMEAAGAAVARAAAELAQRAGSASAPARVVCGKGNNSGDGLVATRALAETGYEAEALLLWPPGELSDDAKSNLERIQAHARHVEPDRIAAALAGSGVVVDAIFGTGFSGAPRAPADAAVEAINSCGAPVVAADIASGVDAATGEVAGVAVEADLTVSFHAAKLGHWIAPGKWHTGELRVAEIGIPPDAPAEPAAGLIESSVLELAPRRGPRSTKFSSGQVLVVGGSRGLTGAVCMAAAAAVRAGAGYATVAVPAALEQIFEVKLTEVMSRGFEGSGDGLGPADAAGILEAAERAAAVVLGPGLGRSDDAFALARELVARVEAPLLVDADGLNALAGRLDDVARRDRPTVLTPHAGELARLLERDSDEVSDHRLAAAREAAAASGAIVVLKGDDTLVVESDRVAVNPLSAPPLATAGTGDVLSGTIGALLARGMEPFEAACGGVLAHARAGLHAAGEVGAESVIATDVIEALPAGLSP